MNQIIQRLAEKATIRVNNPIVNSDGKVIVDDWEEGISISKFAELIVRECVSFAKTHYDATLPWGGVEQILEHFGVEQ